MAEKRSDVGYLGSAWNGLKYYSQTSYYLAWTYGKVRSYVQPWISTDFNVNQVDEAGVFIGDIASAYNRDELKALGITHVITAILGVNAPFPEDFVYLTLPVRDVESEDMMQHLETTTDFINDAIQSGGKVLVHCVCGVSRSATIVAAWLMRTHELDVDTTISQLQAARACVDPNPAFRQQLERWAALT